MNDSLKRTCLYDSHIKLGAKMSPFAGYDMPIQYSSIIEEHNAVRNASGMFDVSHMGEIFISGPQSSEFVQHVFTNDISGMADGKILYGMMCYPDGGVVDDLLVYKEFRPDHYLLVVNASNIEKDYAWLMEQARSYNVIVDNQSYVWGQIAIQGPKSESAVTKILGLKDCLKLSFYEYYEEEWAGTRLIVSRTGYTGEDGFEIYGKPSVICDIWDRLLTAGITPCGLGCRDTLRFEAGLPLYGDELSNEISPIMAGLGFFCKLDKAEFIGKDALTEQKTNGTARKLVGLELEDSAVPRAGYPVLNAEGAQIGVVTTGYHSISLDRSIAFALVDSAYAALGTELQVQIRKHTFACKVVKKRFYQTNYKK